MQSPKTPENEARRLAVLASLSILDSLPEERFDRITRMAARSFNVPIALVSLIDNDRQWFKSKVGLKASETPRDISFCGHAILGDGPFIISDTLKDERFHDNPLVTGHPNVRFYAGYPLKIANNIRLGTLCLIDTKPRTLGLDDIQMFRDMAGMLESMLNAIHLSTTDELTGLNNRRGFINQASSALKLCNRYDMPASLLFIDLDKFKAINDELGHHKGDQALCDFAALITETFRESDVFGRIGGDEFVVLLVNTSDEKALKVIEKFDHNLAEFNNLPKNSYRLECSYGLVHCETGQPLDIEKLLKEGDRRMYLDKRRDKS